MCSSVGLHIKVSLVKFKQRNNLLVKETCNRVSGRHKDYYWFFFFNLRNFILYSICFVRLVLYGNCTSLRVKNVVQYYIIETRPHAARLRICRRYCDNVLINKICIYYYILCIGTKVHGLILHYVFGTKRVTRPSF